MITIKVVVSENDQGTVSLGALVIPSQTEPATPDEQSVAAMVQEAIKVTATLLMVDQGGSLESAKDPAGAYEKVVEMMSRGESGGNN